MPECRTFKPGKVDALAAEALDDLDAVDDDGTPQDVGQDEDVQLFQARPCNHTHHYNTPPPARRCAAAPGSPL